MQPPALISISLLKVLELALTGCSHREPSSYHSLWILANISSFAQPSHAYFYSYCLLLSVMCNQSLWNWSAPRGHHHDRKKIMSHSRTLTTDLYEVFFQNEDHQARNHALQSWAHTSISCGLLFDQLHLVVNFQSFRVSHDVKSVFAFIDQMDLLVQGKHCYVWTIS